MNFEIKYVRKYCDFWVVVLVFQDSIYPPIFQIQQKYTNRQKIQDGGLYPKGLVLSQWQSDCFSTFSNRTLESPIPT